MTLNQLKIFITIAEIGNVTKAAEFLGITQSAASASVASIENTYQVKLFERVGRKIVLSEVGKRFLPEAQNVIASAKNASKNLRFLGKKIVGTINIAASQTIANYWLPKRISVFHTRHPDVSLHVSMLNTENVKKSVIRGNADIGFVEANIVSDELELTEVDKDKIVLVGSKSRWSSFNLMENSIDFKNLPWIVREQGSGTRKVLEDIVLKKNLSWRDLDIILELPSNESVREAVIAGTGFTLISQHVVDLSLENGLLKAANLNLPPRSYQMLNKKKKIFNFLERKFINIIKNK